jgi:hypothetical protein
MRNDSLQEFVKLRRKLAEEKAAIETRLRQINEALGEISDVTAAAASPAARPAAAGRKRGISAEGRARIAAAQRARWAAARGGASDEGSGEETASARRGPRKMSAAARKAISEAAKRRWAERKAAGKNKL